MTVGELRAALEQLPPDLLVAVEYDCRCAGDEIVEAFVDEDSPRFVLSTGD